MSKKVQENSVELEESVLQWTPVSALDCLIPVNVENYDAQVCGWSAALSEALNQGWRLMKNLHFKLRECETKDHQECVCVQTNAKLDILEDFLGVDRS